MTGIDVDMNYFTLEDACAPCACSDDGKITIPEAFFNAVGLMEEIDEIENILDGLGDNKNVPTGDDDIQDKRCLVEMRYEDIDELIRVFNAYKPNTDEAALAGNALQLGLACPSAYERRGTETDPWTASEEAARRWLNETAGHETDRAFDEFRTCIEYLVHRRHQGSA